MNREDIIRMAQEAQMPFYWRTGEITYLDKLERFAALVASAEREHIKQANAPEIEHINAHIKELEDAVKEALAQPEPEPVVCVEYIPCCTDKTCLKCKAATPPQRKPQIWEHEGYDALCQELELWKAEAQRKPLTDEEIQNILPDDGTPMSLGEAFVKFARAIEAAHGIKENT